MKKIFAFSMIAAAMIAASCGDSNDELVIDNPQEEEVINGIAGWVTDKSPIEFYYEPDTLLVYFLSPSQGYLSTFMSFCLIELENTSQSVMWGMGNAPDKFELYAQHYSDTAKYSKRLVRHPYRISAMPLNAISITADKDFDAEHPTGSSLNDLFVLRYASYYELIKSGYNPAIDITNSYWNSETDAYQLLSLSEFEPINLLHYSAELYFTKLPETLGEYTFTISYNFGTDPVTGKEPKEIAPAVVKAEFTDKDYVSTPVRGGNNKEE